MTAALVGTSLTAEVLATASRLIGYCGAGIYEELLFRLIMLPRRGGRVSVWLG